MFGKLKNKFGFLIGNHLESCKEDISRMTLFLEKRGFICEKFFDCYPEEELLKFINKNNFNKNDLLYIHFSGHGKVIGKKINNKIEMISTWVNPDYTDCYSYNIDNILSSLNCKIILISDSCHSGNFGNFFIGNNSYLFIGSSSIVQ